MAPPSAHSATLLRPPGGVLGRWGGLSLLILSGCATTGDLERVQASVADVRRAVDDAVACFEAGDVDATGALLEVQAEAARAEMIATQAARDASERGWTAFERIVGAVVALGGLGLTGYTTYRATNAVRDRRRVARNEPVGPVRRVRKIGAV